MPTGDDFFAAIQSVAHGTTCERLCTSFPVLEMQYCPVLETPRWMLGTVEYNTAKAWLDAVYATECEVFGWPLPVETDPAADQAALNEVGWYTRGWWLCACSSACDEEKETAIPETVRTFAEEHVGHTPAEEHVICIGDMYRVVDCK